MFLDAVSRINSGDYANMNTQGLVYVVETPVKMLINFFAQYVILIKDEQSMKLGYDELALIAIRQADEAISIVFNEEEIDYKAKNSEKGVEEKEFLEAIKIAFEDGVDSSPHESIRLKCEEYGIYFTGKYNKHLYPFILKYSKLFENIVECDMLEENTAIEFLLEENTAGLLDNVSGTAFNVLDNVIGGGPKAWGKVLKGVGKNVGKRAFVSNANKLIGNIGIVVITNKNAIYAKGENIFTIGDDISDVLGYLKCEKDITIAGAVDIYHEEYGKILDNVSEKRWSEFKKVIRKLKSQGTSVKSIGFSDDYHEENNTVTSVSTDDIDVIRDKLLKLKNLLNEELITQEEYNIKKNEILGI